MNNIQATSFKGVNTRWVNKQDMRYINDAMPTLEELGKNYHIKIKSSSYSMGLLSLPALKVTVKSLNPLKRLFKIHFPEYFITSDIADGIMIRDKNIISTVQKAINNLNI